MIHNLRNNNKTELVNIQVKKCCDVNWSLCYHASTHFNTDRPINGIVNSLFIPFIRVEWRPKYKTIKLMLISVIPFNILLNACLSLSKYIFLKKQSFRSLFCLHGMPHSFELLPCNHAWEISIKFLSVISLHLAKLLLTNPPFSDI